MSGPSDPAAVARATSRPTLPRRFYKSVALDEGAAGFAVTLDGKTAKTPGGSRLILPSRRVAEGLAAEWDAQSEFVDPTTMPLTRIANSAIDAVTLQAQSVREDIVAYAGNDLLCYRAENPAELVSRQAGLWDPLLDWAASQLSARLITGGGIVPVRQSDEALAAIGEALAIFDAFPLTALHVATTLTGSAILGLAVAHGRLTAEAAWEAAHLDEDWQIAQWGEVSEAKARRDARWREMEAAAFILGDR